MPKLQLVKSVIHQALLSNPKQFGVWMVEARKGIRWMAWQEEPTKDVVACEKSRGGGKQPLIRESLNGETPPQLYAVTRPLNS